MKRLLLILLLLPLTILSGQSPGGEAGNLLFWLRSDAGTSTTTNGANVWNWTDQSGNGVSPWISSAPVYRIPEVNYNPALDWDGSARLGMQDNGMQGGGNRKTVIIAFKTGSDVNARQVLFEYGVSNPPPFRHGMNIYIDGGNLYGMLIESRVEYSASTPIAPNTAYIFTLVYDGPSGRWDGYLNGTHVINNSPAPSNLPSDYDNGGIGCIQGGTQFAGSNNRVTSGNIYQGHIMELVFYDNDAFDQGERDNMFSYLGAKYGVTIDQDYNFAGGGSTYWDQSSNSTYHNDIAGIIRDDLTDLDQRQAKSASSDALVSVGYSSLASDNPSNGNSIPGDEDYLMWGNDNGSIGSFTTTGAPSSRQILGRTWHIEEAISGSFEVSVPDNSSSEPTKLPAEQTTIYLLADNDADFSSGATEFAMSLNGTDWESTLNLDNYDYFTFATEAVASTPGPGGVSSDLVFWLKADEGTNTTTDGAGVDDWADQSGNGNDATDQGTDPTFDQIANSYNPAIDFSGTNDGLGINNDGDINTNSSSAKSYAVVVKTGSDVNTRQLIYEEGGGTHGLNISIESGNLHTNLWVNSSDNSASTSISANTSYVIIFVYDGGSGRWDT
ncbi:MAG: hypothetical protein U5L96_08060 [Owenweeksia sp.]|nr:hypothetical protein [Owenweeksia sp.]